MFQTTIRELCKLQLAPPTLLHNNTVRNPTGRGYHPSNDGHKRT